VGDCHHYGENRSPVPLKFFLILNTSFFNSFNYYDTKVMILILISEYFSNYFSVNIMFNFVGNKKPALWWERANAVCQIKVLFQNLTALNCCAMAYIPS
jgi:hypothetical protein